MCTQTADVIDCQTCQFYRPQAGFVDAYKDFDRNPPREPLMKSLLDLRKDETHLQENEMELQLELLMTEQKAWPKAPRFAPLCVFPDAGSDGSFIPAVKGRDCQRRAEEGLDGSDFRPALNRQGRACRTCRFLVRPVTKIGDRQKAPTGAGGSQETAFYRQINKEQEDADAMALALEIEQSFIGDGCLPTAYFLPTCAVRVTDGRTNTAPFCNLRNDCKEHRAHVVLPTALLKVVEESAKPPDAVALECTIKVAQFVAASDPQQPGKFLSCLAAWVKQDPSHRWSVATWASSYLHPRWALSENSPAPGSKGSLSKEWGDPPHEPPPPLLPFIAGCDAYEWGRLAAFSAAKNSEQNATIAAAVLCQQVAEFLAAVVSPFDAAACIDAAVELMHSDDLFARKTLDLVDGFMERLRGNAERFRLVAQTDLQEYYEERTGSLSYKMGKWMELTLGDPASLARVDALDEQLGQKVRQQIETKTAEARAEASEILDNLAKLAAGKLSPDDCNGLLNRLIGANDSALERDRADAADLVTEGINIQAEKSGIAAILDQPLPTNPTLTYRTLYMTAIRQTSGVIFDVPRATENPRRQVLATFLLRRGLEPVTPTALEVYGRHPQPGRIAESIEQALSDPVATTVEAFHKALFGSSETVRTYLSPGRRIGVPRFLDVDGNQR